MIYQQRDVIALAPSSAVLHHSLRRELQRPGEFSFFPLPARSLAKGTSCSYLSSDNTINGGFGFFFGLVERPNGNERLKWLNEV